MFKSTEVQWDFNILPGKQCDPYVQLMCKHVYKLLAMQALEDGSHGREFSRREDLMFRIGVDNWLKECESEPCGKQRSRLLGVSHYISDCTGQRSCRQYGFANPTFVQVRFLLPQCWPSTC